MSGPAQGSVRDRPDACPGALRTHRAADGLLVRLRLPGGRLSAASARGLADVADRHADGALHLTSRGNVQLRGVRDVDGGADPALVADVRACGLLPSLSHELVRNVVASPRTGLVGGLLDVGPLVTAVDAALCAEPALAALPGRFLVALDDGTADVAGMDADVTWWAQDDGVGAVLVGGVDTGRRVAADRVTAVVVEVAHAFLEARGDGGAWHVRELPMGAVGFAARLGSGRHDDEHLLEPLLERRHPHPHGVDYEDGPQARSHLAPEPRAAVSTLGPPAPAVGLPELGALRQDDGRCAVATLVPLGRLESGTLRLLADAAEGADGRLVVTPWREVLVPGVPPVRAAEVTGRVAAAGLVTDPASPWRLVSACVGRPSCARALADVRTLAARTAAVLPSAWDTRVHLAGCERRCGRPSSAHREVVAVGAGCEIADVAPASPTAERTRRPLVVLPAADVPAAVAALVDPCTRSSEDT